MASRSPGSDVYTVLVLVAALMLIGAIAYVVIRHGELYEGSSLFDPTARAIADATRGLLRA
jgi:hypothetical protein